MRTFQALGNIYFIHESVKDVATWDFKDLCFAPVDGTQIFSGNIEAVVTKEKAKFPQDFFPEVRMSHSVYIIVGTSWFPDISCSPDTLLS